jgi:hypothetical protein
LICSRALAAFTKGLKAVRDASLLKRSMSLCSSNGQQRQGQGCPVTAQTWCDNHRLLLLHCTSALAVHCAAANNTLRGCCHQLVPRCCPLPWCPHLQLQPQPMHMQQPTSATHQAPPWLCHL